MYWKDQQVAIIPQVRCEVSWLWQKEHGIYWNNSSKCNTFDSNQEGNILCNEAQR